MKKFVFLYVGHMQPDPEIYQQWGDWFAANGEHFVDSGNPFGQSVEITRTDTEALPLDDKTITGYSIVKAESFEAAQKLAETCPFISAIRVYEAVAM